MSQGDGKPYHLVMPVAERLVMELDRHCERIEIAGSLRRLKPMVRDIEIVAIPTRATNIFGEPVAGKTYLDHALDVLGVNFTARGQKYQSFTYNGHKVDLFLPTRETWGSIFAIRTGSADFTHQLVSGPPLGIRPAEIRFSEGRLWHNGKLLRTPQEADVFAAVGLKWIKPENRVGILPPEEIDRLRVEPEWVFEESV